MRFSTIVLFVATALAVPHKGHHKSHSDDQVQQVEKRLAPIALALLTGAGSAAAGWATKEALTQIKSLTSAASNWKEARETFTKTAVDDMMKKIDTDMSWVGAVCYNMGYDVDASKRSDIATLKLKSGPLNTDYDCMYLKSGAQWKGKGDGGFVNLATNSVEGKCTYNKGDLSITCK